MDTSCRVKRNFCTYHLKNSCTELPLFAQVHKPIVFHEPNSSDVSPEFTLKPQLVYKDGTNVMGENLALKLQVIY